MADPVAWLALLPAPPASATCAVPVVDDQEQLVWLCGWHVVPAPGAPPAARWRRPSVAAVRVDPAVVVPAAAADGTGYSAADDPALVVAWTLPGRRTRPLHDDPAVVAATSRAARDGGGLALCTAAVADEVRWAGGLSAVREEVAAGWPGWLSLDPWQGLAPTRVLHVPPGVLRARPLPAGPGLQRRAGEPWPAGRFTPQAQPGPAVEAPAPLVGGR